MMATMKVCVLGLAENIKATIRGEDDEPQPEAMCFMVDEMAKYILGLEGAGDSVQSWAAKHYAVPDCPTNRRMLAAAIDRWANVRGE